METKSPVDRSGDERAFLARLGATVRARRTGLGMSQEGLAERSGHHRNFIGGVERGEQNVSALGLRRLAEALRCTLPDLFEAERGSA